MSSHVLKLVGHDHTPRFLVFKPIFFHKKASFNVTINYLLPNVVCKRVAIPLIKNVLDISFPITTSSVIHNAGAIMIGTESVAPNIVR
mgnify:CR=1 FL=1